jgi:hypothetical protein
MNWSRTDGASSILLPLHAHAVSGSSPHRRSSLKERGLSSRPGWSEGVVRWPQLAVGRAGLRRRIKARPQAAGEAAGSLDADAAWYELIDAEEAPGELLGLVLEVVVSVSTSRCPGRGRPSGGCQSSLRLARHGAARLDA